MIGVCGKTVGLAIICGRAKLLFLVGVEMEDFTFDAGFESET
jgi:hypothetical protein